MAEIGIGVLVALVGVGILAPVNGRLPRPAVIAMSLPVGAAVYVLVVTAIIATERPLDPGLALALTAGIGIVGCMVAAVKGQVGLDLLWTVAIVLVLAAGVAWFARSVHLTRLTIDSPRYLLASIDLQRGGIGDVFRPDLLKRQLGLPALHALAGLTDREYLASLGPLFGASGVGFLGWLVWSRLGGLGALQRRLIVGSALAFVITANRLLFDVFYINTHIQMATLLLITVAAVWFALVDGEPAWALPAGLCLAVMVVFRPEAPLLAVLVLVAAGASRAGWPTRWMLAAPILAVTALWYGVVLWNHAIDGSEVSLTAPVLGNIVAVLAGVGLVLAGGIRRSEPLARLAQRMMLPGLVLVIVAFAVADPSILFESIRVTAMNVGMYGTWIFTWTAAVPLLAIALLVHRFRESRVWTDVIVGFALLHFVLPYLRGSAWRVGSGDSGSRMLAHILMVAVAFIVLAAFEGTSSGGRHDRAGAAASPVDALD